MVGEMATNIFCRNFIQELKGLENECSDYRGVGADWNPNPIVRTGEFDPTTSLPITDVMSLR